MRKHSFNAVNARELESPMMRKPFSPISSTASSKGNMANLLEDQNIAHREPLQKPLPSTIPFSTPSKILSVADEENWTPRAMPISVPKTPSTVSVPMQTAITPAPPSALPFGTKVVEEIPEEIEYSFEERRAGFVLPKAHVKSLISI